MIIRRGFAYCFVLLACLFATGCFAIEQEIFLNQDGSGEFVLHVSLPDLPEELAKSATEMGPKKSGEGDVETIARELARVTLPNLKVKEIKKVKQNGSQGFYMVFQFKDLKDMTAVLANFGKDSFKDSDLKAKPQWSVQLDKRGDRSFYMTKFFLDLSQDIKTEAKVTASPGAKADQQADVKVDADFDKLGQQMLMMFLGTMKMRFVLHAPSPITETNADIVLNSRTAVWNCSPIAFVKEKKPIEMRASF